jgi:arylsulfatase A-like enzyme
MKPNVLVFFTDQQRADTTGVHGCPLDLTPNFDRFAQEGTHCFHAYTCQPVCGPARSCLQTGMYATATGSWRNGIGLDQSLPNLGTTFSQAGYQTGYIGKWHLATHEHIGAVPKEQRGGYAFWLASNLLEFTSDAYDCTVFDGEGKPVKLPGYRVDGITDAAIRYIDSATQSDQPFFLFLSYIEPHHQNHRDDYPAPTGYAERYAGRWIPPDLQTLGGTSAQHLPGYFGMIKRLDEAFGRLLDTLKSLGILENTVVVYTSDHGNHFKTRNAEYKRSCHDASLRVPTALSGPGFSGQGRLQNMVSLVDLPPTLLDAAGLAIPETMQGRSLLRRADGWPGEIFAQISESQIGRCIRTHRWKYSVIAAGIDGNRQPGSDTYTEDCLYDLEADPYELQNLVNHPSHVAVREHLRERLLARMAEAGEPPATILPFPEVYSGFTQRRVESAEVLQ